MKSQLFWVLPSAVHMCTLSHVQLFATPRTVALEAPLSVGFHRQEYWSALPFPPPGDLPNPGMEPKSPAWQAVSLPSESPGKPSPALGVIDFINFTSCSISVVGSHHEFILHFSHD